MLYDPQRNLAQAPRDSSFSILPGIPNPIQAASWTLGGFVGGVVAAAPYTPFVLIGGGMSVVKGLSAMCGQRLEPPTELECNAQHVTIMNSQSIVSLLFF